MGHRKCKAKTAHCPAYGSSRGWDQSWVLGEAAVTAKDLMAQKGDQEKEIHWDFNNQKDFPHTRTLKPQVWLWRDVGFWKLPDVFEGPGRLQRGSATQLCVFNLLTLGKAADRTLSGPLQGGGNRTLVT